MAKKKKKKRPKEVSGSTIKIKTGCGTLFTTINENEDGPFEVFARLGKSGGCASSQTEAIGRLVSFALRIGADPKDLVAELRGISCNQPRGIGDDKVWSCSDAIAQTMEIKLGLRTAARVCHEDAPEACAENEAGCCPDCGSAVAMVEGCMSCSARCGWSKCS